MAQWAQVQNLPGVREIYGAHFPMEIRHFFCVWLEAQPWSVSSSILLHPPPSSSILLLLMLLLAAAASLGSFFRFLIPILTFFSFFFFLRNSINENDERQKDTAQKFTDTLLGLMTGKIEEVRGIWKTVPAIAVKPTTLNCGFFFFFFSSSLLLQSCKVALMTCSCSGCVLRKSLVVSRFASSLFFFSFHFFFS